MIPAKMNAVSLLGSDRFPILCIPANGKIASNPKRSIGSNSQRTIDRGTSFEHNKKSNRNKEISKNLLSVLLNRKELSNNPLLRYLIDYSVKLSEGKISKY